ncbi:hypothetical protein, partial [Streptomyces sp. NPDC001919]
PLPRQHGILAAMLHKAEPERLADAAGPHPPIGTAGPRRPGGRRRLRVKRITIRMDWLNFHQSSAYCRDIA